MTAMMSEGRKGSVAVGCSAWSRTIRRRPEPTRVLGIRRGEGGRPEELTESRRKDRRGSAEVESGSFPRRPKEEGREGDEAFEARRGSTVGPRMESWRSHPRELGPSEAGRGRSRGLERGGGWFEGDEPILLLPGRPKKRRREQEREGGEREKVAIIGMNKTLSLLASGNPRPRWKANADAEGRGRCGRPTLRRKAEADAEAGGRRRGRRPRLTRKAEADGKRPTRELPWMPRGERRGRRSLKPWPMREAF